MTALKDVYSPSFYNNLAECLIEVIPSFDKKKFIKQIFTDAFKQMELKERMRYTSQTLHPYLDKDFGKAAKQLENLVKVLRKKNVGEDGLAMIFLPDYIEVYGIDDFKNAIKSIEIVTQFVSCELAVRPFLLKYFNEMMPVMVQWSLHENYKVRRLASEGSRPRLPWAMAIPTLKKDPTPILPLLENLKNDPSEWVRRSVANSLNDIAKDHPTIVLNLVKQWADISKETDAIIKHGSRTLLKQGHTEILKHFGLDSRHVTVSNFNILTPNVNIGDSLSFSFTIKNNSKTEQKIRINMLFIIKGN